MTQSLLMTGATGNLGSMVARQLLAHNHGFRLLTRDPEKATSIQSHLVDIVQGDMGNVDSLGGVFSGIQTLFLCTPSQPQQVELECNLVDMAQKCGVRHIVKMSSFGADTSSSMTMGQWHGKIEQHILRKRIPFTFLRPNFLMQNTLMFAQSIKAADTFFIPLKTGRVSMVDLIDVSFACMRVLTTPGHENKIYHFTGPEALSYTEVAQKLSLLLGKDVQYASIASDVAADAMMEAGVPHWLCENLKELYSYLAEGKSQAITSHLSEVTNMTPRTYDDFLKDHRQFFL